MLSLSMLRVYLNTNLRHVTPITIGRASASNGTGLPKASCLPTPMSCPPASQFCYGQMSRLIYRGSTTWCQRGQQGCPIMARYSILAGLVCYWKREVLVHGLRPSSAQSLRMIASAAVRSWMSGNNSVRRYDWRISMVFGLIQKSEHCIFWLENHFGVMCRIFKRWV